MKWSGFIFLGICWLLASQPVQAQVFSYKGEPLHMVIEDIEAKTEYRFLYREALVNGINISLDANLEQLFEELSPLLYDNNLGIKVDTDRFQALIYRSVKQQKSQQIHVSGYVVDSETGERLPYATLSWRENGELKGVSSSGFGAFDFILTSGATQVNVLTSYIGYTPNQLELSVGDQIDFKDVVIRLHPEAYNSKEIVVRGVNFYTPNDTLLSGMMKVGAFSPLGETNAVRSLQMLPSVSMNAAVNDGINIRGSAQDGFQVLLDGQTIYNQSHLFGLVDAMNGDVLKSSGFYYDITPAQYRAPLGGTLSLITRTGSLNDFRGSAGISNTAFKTTLEGPLLKGKASWLISGRLSFIDDLNWFNNQSLVEYGLDVNRPAKILIENQLPGLFFHNMRLNTIDIQNTEANFYDTHAKIHYETKNGAQLSVSGYFGFDEANQLYLRDENAQITLNETKNFWDNSTLSAAYTTRVGPMSLSESRIGYTVYGSEYSKDDFEFPLQRDSNGANVDTVLLSPLSLSNSVNQFEAFHSFTTYLSGNRLEVGLSYSDFDVQYKEISYVRQSFLSRRTSQLVDFFQQFDANPSSEIKLNLGSRFHYFSNGQYLRWSPRLKVNYQIHQKLSAGVGFSRNYQFINRLQFYNINSNDFWVLANEDQPPSAVNSYSGGMYWNTHQKLYLQAEVYFKSFENLRYHELNTQLISQTFRNNEVPWLFDNEGRSKGIELLMKNRFDFVSFSTAYTYSVAELRSNLINDGEYFFADWDRRHQLSAVSEIKLLPGLSGYLSWTYGSGSPSRLGLSREIDNSSRLPNYSRVDATISWDIKLSSYTLKADVSVYNLLDRDNPWYAERKQVSVVTRNRVHQGQAITNVFDLGIQPSFSLSVYF